jgi:hypothetical protein
MFRWNAWPTCGSLSVVLRHLQRRATPINAVAGHLARRTSRAEIHKEPRRCSFLNGYRVADELDQIAVIHLTTNVTVEFVERIGRHDGDEHRLQRFLADERLRECANNCASSEQIRTRTHGLFNFRSI